GLSVAQGDWIAFLDSDDTWCESKIEQQLQALTKEPQSLICHTDEIWIRNGVRVNPMNKHLKSGGNIFEQCLPRCVISPSSVLLHRSVFEEFGGFDEELPACEDYDLWLRLCAKLTVTYLPEKLVVKFGGHDDQLSRKYWGMDRFRIASLEKLIRSGVLTTVQIQSASNEMLTKLDVYLQGARRRDHRDECLAYERKRDWARCCLEEPEKYADSRFDTEEATG
ncbi:MAG: glycosyltransferase, partial [Pseudomonadota bacterium]|nr:glycosyltransferase [Pseudomonadota bacterium]